MAGASPRPCGFRVAGVGAGGARGGRHRRGSGAAAGRCEGDPGGQARELLLDRGARRGAHLLGLRGGGGSAEGPGRAPCPLHGTLKLLPASSIPLLWLLLVSEFEIKYANVHSYVLIL